MAQVGEMASQKLKGQAFIQQKVQDWMQTGCPPNPPLR